MVTASIGRTWRFREEIDGNLIWDNYKKDGSLTPYSLTVQKREKSQFNDNGHYEILLAHTDGESKVIKQDIEEKEKALDKAEEWMSNHQSVENITKTFSKK